MLWKLLRILDSPITSTTYEIDFETNPIDSYANIDYRQCTYAKQ